jgi:hypothetical protein
MVLVVSTAWGVMPRSPSWAERAMEKQEAWAAAISSSGLVPGASSKRVLKLNFWLVKAPLETLKVPLPSFRLPVQVALAMRFMGCSAGARRRVDRGERVALLLPGHSEAPRPAQGGATCGTGPRGPPRQRRSRAMRWPR